MTGVLQYKKHKVEDEVAIKETGLEANQTTAYRNFTPGYIEYISLIRDVSSEDVRTQKLDVMPGFKFTWWYTGAEVTPVSKFKDDEMTKHFVR